MEDGEIFYMLGPKYFYIDYCILIINILFSLENGSKRLNNLFKVTHW